jgi:hypothetical protein
MTLVYQAYGVQDVIEQTFFSILSLYHNKSETSPIKVAVYTDRKDLFENFFGSTPNIELVEINREQINMWRGHIDFVHRVKIEILKDAGNRYKDSIFYCDGDTFFKEDPTELFSQVNKDNSLMHIFESCLGRPDNRLTKKVFRSLKNRTFSLRAQPVQFNEDHEMWNAGVIGIDRENLSYFDDILSLTDQLYAHYPKHVMEQLAVSYVLQTRSKLFSAKNTVHHYWNQKPQYQAKIKSFLRSYGTFGAALDSYKQFRFPSPPQPKVSGVRQAIQKLFNTEAQA